jgi:hypothetical protein
MAGEGLARGGCALVAATAGQLSPALAAFDGLESARLHPCKPLAPPWVVPALAIALLVAFAARQLYRAPYSASELRLVPDSQEYAIVGRRLATEGRYDIVLDGKSYPPGTSSWFPVLVAPIYRLAPGELGNAVLPVLAFALAGALCAFALGARLSNPVGGALAGLALVLQRDYFSLARMVMSDVPAVACALGACAMYVSARRSPRGIGWHLAAGLLIGLAFGLRTFYLTLLLPFALRWLRALERRFASLAALTAPTLAVLVATWIYQARTFGDWTRGGFQYWLSVPYDYPSLVFSSEYLAANVAVFGRRSARIALALGLLGAVLLARKRPAGARELLELACLAALPISLAHLVYYYPDLRFHLFLLALGCVAGAAGIAALLPSALQRRAWLLAAGIAAAGLCVPRAQDPTPMRRVAADAIFAATPADATVVTGLDGVYLAALEPADSRRTYVPISRLVEYAAGLIAPRKVHAPDPAPRDAYDRRAEGLRAGGSFDPVPFTAAESVPRIAQWVREGRAVFLDLTSQKDQAAIELLAAGGLAFAPLQGWPSLRRIVLREGAAPLR